MLTVALPKPEPIGPWIDIKAAKIAGEEPYVTRCPATGRIHDRILGVTFASSVAYARAWGHQQHTVEPLPRTSCMAEWAGDRKAWKMPKVTQGTVAKAHREFWSKDASGSDDEPAQSDVQVLDLDEFEQVVISYLDQKGFTDDVISGFLAVHPLDDPRHKSNASVFAAGLLPRIREYVRENQAFRSNHEPSEGHHDEEPGEMEDCEPLEASAPARSYRARLTSGFTAHRGDLHSVALLENLSAAVLEFSSKYQARTLSSKSEGAKTSDDLAQELAIQIFDDLPNLDMTPEGFAAYVETANFNKAKSAQREATKRMAKFKPQMLSDENGGLFDNPEMCRHNSLPQYRRALPEFIEGINLRICQYIREGLGYREIAQVLETSEQAVKSRVDKMRKQIAAERQAATMQSVDALAPA